VVVLGGEESLGRAEVGAADQETDLVCGFAQGFGHVEQAGRDIEGVRALGHVEDRRRFIGLPLGGVKDDHSRHGLGSRNGVVSRIGFTHELGW
jgi:hypothetical protein